MKNFRYLFLWPLLLGITIRVLLAVSTIHPDLWGHSFTAYFLAEKGIFNVYDHLLALPDTHPLVRNFGVQDIFIYPPLAYYTLGVFRFLAGPFVSLEFIPWLWQNLADVLSYPHLASVLFWFKIFYLPFDIGAGLLLAGLFKSKGAKKAAFWLWMINPLSLYVSYMMGQLDLLPTFFIILAFFLLARRRYYLGLASLGVAASYKMFPLFLIPAIAFAKGKNFKKKILLLISGLLPFLVFITPYLPSVGFRSMVLFAPKSQKMLFMGWPVSGAEVVFPFVAILFFLYFRAFYQKNSSTRLYFSAILALILSVTHFHPQWFLWLTPFLIYDLVKSKFLHWPIIATFFVCWLGITLLFEPSLSVGLFAPLNPSLANAKGLAEMLPPSFDAFKVKSLLRSILAGTSFFWVWRLAKEDEK